MELYIAICIDHHIDEVVRVFSTKEKAIDFCKEFADGEYLQEEQLTDAMIQDGWLYLASYGVDGDGVRVEKGTLDPSE